MHNAMHNAMGETSQIRMCSGLHMMHYRTIGIAHNARAKPLAFQLLARVNRHLAIPPHRAGRGAPDLAALAPR